jgi:hypothetical protein
LIVLEVVDDLPSALNALSVTVNDLALDVEVFEKVCEGALLVDEEPSPKSHSYLVAPEEEFVNVTIKGVVPDVLSAVKEATGSAVGVVVSPEHEVRNKKPPASRAIKLNFRVGINCFILFYLFLFKYPQC